MNQVRNIINKGTEWLVCGILAFMTLLVTWQVITRFVFKSPSTVTEALAKYLFVWLVLIMAAYVVGKREHMAIEFFVARYSVKTKTVLDIIVESCIFLFAAIVLTYGGGYIAINAMSQSDPALSIPMGIVYLALPVSGVLSMFYSSCNLIEDVKKFSNKALMKQTTAVQVEE